MESGRLGCDERRVGQGMAKRAGASCFLRRATYCRLIGTLDLSHTVLNGTGAGSRLWKTALKSSDAALPYIAATFAKASTLPLPPNIFGRLPTMKRS